MQKPENPIFFTTKKSNEKMMRKLENMKMREVYNRPYYQLRQMHSKSCKEQWIDMYRLLIYTYHM